MRYLIVVAALWAITGAPARRRLAGWADQLRTRQPLSAADEARLLRDLASDVTAGLHPAAALSRVTSAYPQLDVEDSLRLVTSGRGVAVVAAAIGKQLPVNSDVIGASIALATDTGSGLAAVLHRLAERADMRAAENREHSVATAQARISAVVVGGLPLVGVATMAVSGAFSGLDSLTKRVVLAGVALVATGLGITAWMVRS